MGHYGEKIDSFDSFNLEIDNYLCCKLNASDSCSNLKKPKNIKPNRADKFEYVCVIYEWSFRKKWPKVNQFG